MKMVFLAPVLGVLITLGFSETSCRLQVESGAIISNDAKIEGDVTIGSNAIVSPKAKIIAEAGPIVIGYGLIMQENASITNKKPGHTLYIGNGNIFESGSTCDAFRVGNGNILKSNCFVGRKVEIGNGCIITPGCRFTKPGFVSNGKIIDGAQCE